MEYLMVAIAGMFGGRLGYPNPDDPDSPQCKVCGLAIGLISSIIYYMVLKSALGADHSLVTLSVLGVVGGAAGAALVGSAMGLAGGKKGG